MHTKVPKNMFGFIIVAVGIQVPLHKHIYNISVHPL